MAHPLRRAITAGYVGVWVGHHVVWDSTRAAGPTAAAAAVLTGAAVTAVLVARELIPPKKGGI